MTTTRNYNAVFLLDLRGQEENSEQWGVTLQDTIKKLGGEPGEVKDRGHRNFERTPKRDFQAGTFLEIPFSGPPEAPAQLKEAFRLEKAVNRIHIELVHI